MYNKGNNEVQRLTTELAVESGKFREDMLSSMKRKICAVAIENLVDVKVEEEIERLLLVKRKS